MKVAAAETPRCDPEMRATGAPSPGPQVAAEAGTEGRGQAGTCTGRSGLESTQGAGGPSKVSLFPEEW